MVPIAMTGSLLSEFQSMLEILTANEAITCYGTTPKKKRCGNFLSKATREKITSLLSKLILVLNEAGQERTDLLQKISSLVMCIRYHQDQAVDKCEQWKALPIGDGKFSQGENNALRSEDAPPSILRRARGNSGLKSTVNPHPLIEVDSSKGYQLYSEPDHDDSGYFSGIEDDFTTREGNSPVVDYVGERSSSPSSTEYKPPKTPQRPPLPVSNDSGFSEPTDDNLIKTEECPESPSAGQARRKSQRLAANAKTSSPNFPLPPEIFPLPKTHSRGPKIPTPRTFIYSSKFSPREASMQLRGFLAIPLTPKAIKKGHIYCFQIDGCGYTKIGYTTVSVARRTKAHETCGWWNAQVMISKKAAHVFRVEQIIHKHLDAVRMHEVEMAEGSNGRNCDHRKHKEWFDVDFRKLYIVVNAWARWMESTPYVTIGGEESLSPTWIENLKALELESSGDIWLQWLSHCLPDSMKWLNGGSPESLKLLNNSDSIREIKEDEYESSWVLWSGYEQVSQCRLGLTPERSTTL